MPVAMNITPSLLAILVASSACLLAWSIPAQAGELWVTPGGSDRNPGSSNAPLASLQAALEKCRTQPDEVSSHPAEVGPIVLRDGIYPLVGPVLIQPPMSAITIEAAPGEHPVLSGAMPIGNWTKAAKTLPGLPALARGNIWVAAVPKLGWRFLQFRQLWVNDRKAVRARNPNDGNLARLVAWDKTNQAAAIPAALLAGVKKPAQLEMLVDQVWEIAVLRVKSIHVKGTNAWLTFKEPESRIEFQHPWPPVTVNAKYQAPFFLANALEFLDEPGEWFEDVAAGKVYYWPRAGEDMTRAKVYAPALETLVQLEGTPETPVTGVRFKGIAFAHTTWLRPSQQGHVPLQAGMFMLDARKLSPRGTPYHPGLDNLAWIGRPPAAVSVKNAARISFENCAFEHLASAGLDFQSGTHDDLTQGCVFHDLGGNGIQLGRFSDTNVETHVPYAPADARQICAHEKIADNFITDCGNEDWGCVGIGVGYAQNVSLEHNEVSDLPYTGISVGWGWTKMASALRDNLVFANRIQHVGRRLGDLGGIYTLSAQPGTVIAENFISDLQPSRYVPDSNHWYYLYLDEGSSYITVRDNWCPAEKFLKNANGPGNTCTNNGPQVSQSVKDAAGLEPVFKNQLPPCP